MDTELRQQELERDNLQNIISALETATAVSSPASRATIQISLTNARGHLAALEKKIKDTEAEHEQQSETRLAFAVQEAERETKLSSTERKTFGDFLKKDFFTKADFGRLDDFYKKAWDRLSEHGKDEMSHRIWDGIRHKEYEFHDLPQSVQEKETKQAYKLLHDAPVKPEGIERIPEKDRQDFIRAYEAGKQDEAKRVLERDSFKKNMFLESDSKEIKHAKVELGQSVSAKEVEKGSADVAKSGKDPEVQGGGKSGVDVSGLKLDSLQMAEAPAKISSSDIAVNAKGNQSPGRC